MNGELGANKVSLGGNDAKAVFALRADQGQSADYLCFSILCKPKGETSVLAYMVCTWNEITKRSGATEVSSQYEASVVASKSI